MRQLPAPSARTAVLSSAGAVSEGAYSATRAPPTVTPVAAARTLPRRSSRMPWGATVSSPHPPTAQATHRIARRVLLVMSRNLADGATVEHPVPATGMGGEG
jgi:hypothetical protein